MSETEPSSETQTQFPRLGVHDEPGAVDQAVSNVSDWLHDRTLIPCDVSEGSCLPVSKFSNLLGCNLVSRLTDDKIKSLFPAQAQVIPKILDPAVIGGRVPPRDMCIASPTGSGKTLVYVLPIIAHLQKRVVPRIRALVVVPTQPLAKQVYSTFVKYTTGTDMRVQLLASSKSVDRDRRVLWNKQANGEHVCDGADIVVCTVGRLYQHLRFADPHDPTVPSSLDLSQLRFLVIDEADRVMSDNRVDWSSPLLAAVYDSPFANRLTKRCTAAAGTLHATQQAAAMPLQKIFVSATLMYNATDLRKWNLFHPQLFVAVGNQGCSSVLPQPESSLVDDEGVPIKAATVPVDMDDMHQVVLPVGLSQFCVNVGVKFAPLAVYSFIVKHACKKVVCFTENRQHAHRLCTLLQLLLKDEQAVVACTAELFPSHREKKLNRFRRGNARILVCSDLVARGMQLDNVDTVVNYSTPHTLKQYVHRAGRTARASSVGQVLTLCSHQKQVEALEQMLDEHSLWSQVKMLQMDDDIKEQMDEYKLALTAMKDRIKDGAKGGGQKKGNKNQKQQSGKKVTNQHPVKKGGKSKDTKKQKLAGSKKLKGGSRGPRNR